MSIPDRSKLGVIGFGNMAEAIVRGLLSAGGWTPDRIIGSAKSAERRESVQSRLSVRMVEDNRTVVAECDVLMLGVKPQMAAAVLPPIADVLTHDPLIVSIMAGVSSTTIDRLLGGGRRIVRTMPNTPVLAGKGMVAIAPGPRATAADNATVHRLFESSAVVIDLTEDQLHAVTAVSGSGPAYFFYFVEQMTAAGVALGLSPDQAKTLANQTIAGAAAMLIGTDDGPAELRRKVTSPNGTTHAAIETFRAGGFEKLVSDAMTACVRRSREIANAIS